MQFDETDPDGSRQVPDKATSTNANKIRDEGPPAAGDIDYFDRQWPPHRLGAVRRQQGVSLKNMARRLGVDIETVIAQEQETADPRLSTIYAWQKILEVPVAELLDDSDAPLSAPVYERARMVKLMKTAAAILETARADRVRRLASNLIAQLVAIMPELREVSAWNTVGHRRTLDEYGRVFERRLPDDFANR